MSILNKEYAIKRDQEDLLKKFRDEFYIPPSSIYFDGNSLGLMSKRAEKSALSLLDSWKKYGIDGWTEGENPWYYLSEHLGERMAPLVGASSEEVIVTGSTTVNLHQLVASFYQPTEGKSTILADDLNFPSDIYALKSQLGLKGFDSDHHLKKIPSRDGHTLELDDIYEAMTDDVALIVLPSVLYRSGQILPMKEITLEAKKRNIIIGFDLCHSIGAIPHELSKWGVDFAFWCTYKHLNGGPGSTGALYVNKKHFGRKPGLAGWFSSDKTKQFDMEHKLTVAGNAGAYQIGTPNLLSIAPLIGSLEIFEEAGIDKIRKKSLELTEYIMQLVEGEFGDEFIIRNPKDEKSRGAHIFLEHPEAARICHALKDQKVIPDFRAPKGIRIAPVALYNSFEEVWQTVQILKKIMNEKLYENFDNERGVIA